MQLPYMGKLPARSNFYQHWDKFRSILVQIGFPFWGESLRGPSRPPPPLLSSWPARRQVAWALHSALHARSVTAQRHSWGPPACCGRCMFSHKCFTGVFFQNSLAVSVLRTRFAQCSFSFPSFFNRAGPTASALTHQTSPAISAFLLVQICSQICATAS